MSIWQPKFLFWIIFFVCFCSCDFLHLKKKNFSILMVIISLELTRVNPDRNIFSINVELTSAFLLYRGLVHHHHRILKVFKGTVVNRALLSLHVRSLEITHTVPLGWGVVSKLSRFLNFFDMWLFPAWILNYTYILHTLHYYEVQFNIFRGFFFMQKNWWFMLINNCVLVGLKENWSAECSLFHIRILVLLPLIPTNNI